MIVRFFRSEPAAGIVLFVAAALALVVANTPLETTYNDVLHHHLGGLSIHAWINDALMAIFFLQVGLELKREFIEGEMSTWASRTLPGLAALGGMIAPAVIYALINRNDSEHLRGWAIPTATDIAFAIGVLTLLGPRVPAALRLLLVGIAVVDDLGAIVIIALFYTSDLSVGWLGGAAAIWMVMMALGRMGVRNLIPFLALGIVLWVCVFQSGIHATLAGVLTAMAIPARAKGYSPIQVLEIRLDAWVSFLILPLFGFANAGLSLSGLSRDDLTGSLTLGVVAGLVLGKQLGVLTAIWLAVGTRVAVKPAGVSWPQLYGLSLLCGIGFTMSLFIGGLAFESHPHLMDATRLGVLSGSAISALTATLLLRRTLRNSSPVRKDRPDFA